jgi:hypothetical protein
MRYDTEFRGSCSVIGRREMIAHVQATMRAFVIALLTWAATVWSRYIILHGT